MKQKGRAHILLKNKLGFRYLICLALVFFIRFEPNLFAQEKAGFEWIRSYQPYLKFKIASKGVYRFDSTALLVWAGKDPRRFQLFRNGEEQPLFVHGATDGQLNAGDFIEFVGIPNDGLLDKELYRSASEQPQTYRSLFNDSSVYFLTVLPDTSVIQPLRATNFADNDYTNYTPESRLLVNKQQVPQEDYYYGAFLPAIEKYYISEYADAEGMMSALIGQGQYRSYAFQTPSVSSLASATVKVKVLGASDYYLPDPNLPNHHVKVWISANAQAPVALIDTTFRGYGERLLQKNFPQSMMGSDSTRIYVEVVNDLGLGSDYVGVSFVDLSYSMQTVYQPNESNYLLAPSQLGSKTRLQITGLTGSQPLLWDPNQLRRVSGSLLLGQANFLLPFINETRPIYFLDASQITYLPAPIPVVFSIPNPSLNYQFLIVSNRYIQTAAEQYKQYRSNKYQTLLAYAEDLSDYYTYGYLHPLAIRRFAKHLFTAQVKAPEYLLLLGRGYQNNLLKLYPETQALNLVPAWGVPSSDHLFTNGFVSANGAPAIATGRIPAATNQEAINYLNKLVYAETHPDSITSWHKDFLHLSGGSYESQQNAFRNQLAYLADMVKAAPTGAKVNSYYKSTTAPTEDNLQDKLVAHLNQGTNMMTFYGHGSLTVLDMDFGSISDLTETNKCTFYYFNGCNIGNANDIDPQGSGLVYGKDYICAASKGAIGWLAHTNLTFTNQLENQMNLLYTRLAADMRGKSIGLQIKSALEASTAGNEAFARSHGLQLLLQGDPAYVLYAPAKPEYEISSSDLYIYPSNATVQNDSLALGIIIHNLAKAGSDTISVDIKRTFPDNRVVNYPAIKVNGPYYSDTIYYWFNHLGKADIGDNNFQVTINANQEIAEYDYTNNQASLNYFIPGSGVQALFPHNYAIVHNDSVEFTAQNNNLFVLQAEYVFELDNSPDFLSSSPYFKSSGIISSSHLAKWKTKITAPDSMVFYWRVKLNLPASEGGSWTTRSFTYLPKAGEGWHQQVYSQIKNADEQSYIVFNDSTQQIEFSNTELVLGIENRRWDHRRMGVIIPYLLNAGVGSCISQGVVALVFEPFQVDFPYELPNYPFNCAFVQANKQDQSVRYYTFNTLTSQGQQDLSRLIDSVPEGYYVAMFSRYSSGLPAWSGAVKGLFAKIGSVKVPQVLSDNTAWAVIGKKGEAPGLATEDTVINNALEGITNLPPAPSDPQDEVYLRITRNIQLKWHSGNFVSAPIGPAKSFHKVYLSLFEPDAMPLGRYWVDVLASDGQGKDTLWATNITSDSLDISSIPASRFPYLQLRLNFVDSANRTPHQLNYWQVSYTPSSELSIDPNSDYLFYAATLERGDTLKLRLPLTNIGASPYDSARHVLEVYDANRNLTYSQNLDLPSMLPGNSRVAEFNIPTFNMQGLQSLQFTANLSKFVPELSYLNNYFRKDFLVKGDAGNPYLEVTFDGQRIFNGDIVSPNPEIRISSTDKSKYLLQNDTSTFSLFIRRPGQILEEPVYMNNPNVQFIPATTENRAQLVYKPVKLTDGTYRLKVQARDASGNTAGLEPLSIDFSVVNKSTLTHFYPYPNPFTTRMRFVFTLTGSQVPDQLLVRIMTVSGKVVREVRKEEFGPIRIGNNISEFAWDGTDQFGDPLANGVYLYQVYAKINGNSIEHATTKAKEESSYFVNGSGKIYLMR